MITPDSIIRIGQLVKPHGIKGEITATLDYDIDLDQLSCIVIEIDGIYVPFFIAGVRPKSTENVILKLDDIDHETAAKELCGKDYFAMRNDVEIESSLDENGGYLSDFIGFTLCDVSGKTIGEISDYDDSTDNILFKLTLPDGKTQLIPVADELIEHIDPEQRNIKMSLPEGLFDL